MNVVPWMKQFASSSSICFVVFRNLHINSLFSSRQQCQPAMLFLIETLIKGPSVHCTKFQQYCDFLWKLTQPLITFSIQRDGNGRDHDALYGDVQEEQADKVYFQERSQPSSRTGSEDIGYSRLLSLSEPVLKINQYLQKKGPENKLRRVDWT